MSVVVIVRFQVPDVAKAMEVLSSHAALLEEVTVDAKSKGAIHHRFLAGDGELVVVDEWGAAEQFQGFFAGNASVEQITIAAGVTGPAEVMVFSPVDAPGTF